VIDFHCHLDLFPDPVAVLEGITARRMYVLVVTTTPKAWKGTSQLVAGRERVRVSPGLHPELVAERHSEAPLLCHLIGESPYVGEVGLDGSPQHRASFARQEDVLDRVLKACATAGGRIISMHSRGAASNLLDMIEAHPDLGIPVLHWFSGKPAELERAIELGCWFSVGPAMTSSKKGLALAASMPKERVLTETDSPFTSSKMGDYFPWHVKQAEFQLGGCWNWHEKEVHEQIILNFRRLTTIARKLPLTHSGIAGA
jgi:TatD DNase family protein